jgi:hypothetical protein
MAPAGGVVSVSHDLTTALKMTQLLQRLSSIARRSHHASELVAGAVQPMGIPPIA